MSLLKTLLLSEAYNVRRKELGEVPFIKSKLSDKYVAHIIDEVAKETGIPAATITAGIEKELDKIEELKQYSKKLYETMAANEVEHQAFKLVEKSKKLKDRVKFDPVVFAKLLRLIQKEHKGSFFPLRSPDDDRQLYFVSPILVPSDKPGDKEWNSVDTAAATGEGKFIFNKDFMQTLMDFANLKGLKPKGKKYVSNGGEIPDEYAYLEFLILHELFHYRYGDFKQAKLYPEYSHKVHNWASDFRSNYSLVKSGYEQLPLGLFSDHINLDRQGSYHELVKTVKEELDKLPKPLSDWLSEKLDQATDEHRHPGQDKKKTPMPGDFDPDKAHEKVEGRMQDRKEQAKEGEEGEGEGEGKGKPSQRGGRGAEGDASQREQFDYKNVKPKLNWRDLLEQFIRSASEMQEETYAKISRRGLTGAVTAAQAGAGAVKPGEINVDDDQMKMLFVMDASGSMTRHIPQTMSDIKRFITQHHGSLAKDFAMIKFSDGFKTYIANIAKKQYVESPRGKVPKNAKLEKGSVEKLFSETIGSSTNFNAKVADEIRHFIRDGYNVIIFSDSDMLAPGNIDELAKLYNEARQNVFFIADSRDTFQRAAAHLKQVPRTFSHY